MTPKAPAQASPPISDMFKGHSYMFAASKEAKKTFNFGALVRKIRLHGGTVETVHDTPGLERFLITDIKDESRLIKLIGAQALASLSVRGLDYIDGVVDLWEKARKNSVVEVPAEEKPNKAAVARSAQPVASGSGSNKRSRSTSPASARRPPPVSPMLRNLPIDNSPLPPFMNLPPNFSNLVNQLAATLPSASVQTPQGLAAALNLPTHTFSSSSTTRIQLPPHPSLKGEALHYFNPDLPPAGFKAGVVLAAPSKERDARGIVADPAGIWGFPRDMVPRFPALNKRNFFVIQWHQATALHYDLRLQCAFSAANPSDGNFIRLPEGADANPGTISWAVPKGVHGLPLGREGNARLAAQTNLHPISYTTYEGGNGRRLASGEMCGTLLWDIGTYTVHEPNADPDSDTDSLPSGPEYQERLLLDGLLRRSFSITLHGQHKVKRLTLQFSRTGVRHDSRAQAKPEWLIRRTERGGKGIEVGCEEGGRSCLTGRTLKDVCGGEVNKWVPWADELGLVPGMEEE